MDIHTLGVTEPRRVLVKPLSSKAKNRFANIMQGNPVCTVEQEWGDDVFLVSENRNYCFWVSLRLGANRFGDKTDKHWEITEENNEIPQH